MKGHLMPFGSERRPLLTVKNLLIAPGGPTLTVFLMMYGFQQIVTQTEGRDNFVVHGLTPHEVKWVISLSM
jgi:hypothetical protein